MKNIMMALMLCLVSIAGFADEPEKEAGDFPTDTEVAADEAETDAEGTTYKTFDENGNIIIVREDGKKYNLRGQEIK